MEYGGSQKSTWMDLYLFTEWFVCEFEPKVKSRLISLKLPVNAFFILANVFTHQDEVECDGETGIKLYFLPTNVSAFNSQWTKGKLSVLKENTVKIFFQKFCIT